MIVLDNRFRVFWEPVPDGPALVKADDMQSFRDGIALVLPGISRSAARRNEQFTIDDSHWDYRGETMLRLATDVRPSAWWVCIRSMPNPNSIGCPVYNESNDLFLQR